MNGHELTTSSPRQSKNETDANHFVLTFENNRYASELFGQFDQNLKLIEQRLNIDARARGNSVSISGDVVATGQAAARSTISMTASRRAAPSSFPTSRAPSAWRRPPTTS